MLIFGVGATGRILYLVSFIFLAHASNLSDILKKLFSHWYFKEASQFQVLYIWEAHGCGITRQSNDQKYLNAKSAFSPGWGYHFIDVDFGSTIR